MNAEDVGLVLAKASAYDQRNVGTADVLAWLEVVGDIDVTDALDAVARHYREETTRIMPADLRRRVKQLREDRRRATTHEVRALPSRFEDDVTRDLRLKDGVQHCRDVLAAIAARLEVMGAHVTRTSALLEDKEDQPLTTRSDQHGA